MMLIIPYDMQRRKSVVSTIVLDEALIFELVLWYNVNGTVDDMQRSFSIVLKIIFYDHKTIELIVLYDQYTIF